jgi:hypothetical protein
MGLVTVRPEGERWAVAALRNDQAIKLGRFANRADAMKAGRVIAQILGVEFTP